MFWSRMTWRPRPIPDATVDASLYSCNPCISFTNWLYMESFSFDWWLKAQQTPESVMTGVKISEQLTRFPCQVHFLNMKAESSERGSGEQGRADFQSRRKRLG